MRLGHVFLVIAAVLSSGALVNSKASAGTVDSAEVTAWLQSWAEDGFLSGCVLVARGDSVLYERCFGDANAELGVPNSPDTRFAIASVTKPLHQILLARSVDAGLVTLEDTLSKWIPDFPRGGEITLFQVAVHRAGIPHRVTEPRDEILERTAAEMVVLVKEKGLIADPNAEEIYSSAGYSVMARVLELAGNDSWEDMMEREVFAVAGMTQTVHPAERRLVPGRASSYKWTPGGLRLTDPKDLSFLVGAGSLYSTPRDLLRFVRTLVDGGFGETAREYVLSDGDLTSNGLTNGYRAFVDYDSATDLSVIVCANIVTGALGRLRDSLPQVVAGETPPVAQPPSLEAMSSTQADFVTYEGNYELRPGRELSVRSADTHLDVDGWMLLPYGPDTFFCVQDFGEVVFEFGDDGKVTGLLWGEDGYRMPRVGDIE